MRGFDDLQSGWRRVRDGFAADALTVLISLPLLAVVCGLVYIGAGSVFRPAGMDRGVEQVAWRAGGAGR